VVKGATGKPLEYQKYAYQNIIESTLDDIFNTFANKFIYLFLNFILGIFGNCIYNVCEYHVFKAISKTRGTIFGVLLLNVQPLKELINYRGD